MKKFVYNNIRFHLGQTANENWILFDEYKKLSPYYMWFHLNSFKSPYVIMEASLEELEKEHKLTISEINDLLNYGASLCKENSKFSFLSNLKIIYCPLKNLTKGNKIGEVIVNNKKKYISL